jgi:hypothetical protein
LAELKFELLLPKPRSEPSAERGLPLLGGVNERAVDPELAKLRALLFPISRPPPSRPLAVPALGLPIDPDPEPENPRDADSFPFARPPPAANPLTWFCAIDCCRCEVSCWNEVRATLLCDP